MRMGICGYWWMYVVNTEWWIQGVLVWVRPFLGFCKVICTYTLNTSTAGSGPARRKALYVRDDREIDERSRVLLSVENFFPFLSFYRADFTFCLLFSSSLCMSRGCADTRRLPSTATPTSHAGGQSKTERPSFQRTLGTGGNLSILAVEDLVLQVSSSSSMLEREASRSVEMKLVSPIGTERAPRGFVYTLGSP